MISSAVIIPEEQPPAFTDSPTSLKRRQSSFSTDSSKRPRLEAGTVPQNGSVAGQQSPKEQRPSATPSNVLEEKKRGRRLFGALLGTLSQTSSKPAHRKRDEIEQRQRERLQKDNEEREEEVKRKREDLNTVRRVEQKSWDEESRRLRHRNMRAMANSLQTKTEPRLYYRPWDLRPQEEQQIKRQREEVENTIQSESTQHSLPEESTGDGPNRQTQDEELENSTSETIDNGTGTNNAVENGPSDPAATDEVASHSPSNTEKAEPPKEDDQGGGELVEGQEDDVMY